MAESEHLIRRYLRQRLELGETTLLLDSLTSSRVMDLLASRGTECAADAVRVAPPMRAEDEVLASGKTATSTAAATDDLITAASFSELRDLALACTRCGLSSSRGQVVFGEGSPDAELLVVGEAPGGEEDRTGRPFVGRAGKMLDTLLASVGLPRESVYICNVLKCRPPANRNPLPAEVSSCSPYLIRQLELIRPRAILACGTFAAQTLLETGQAIGSLRGAVHSYRGVPLIPTYHPAALLRNPAWVRPVWEDLQRLRSILDEN